MNRDDTSFRSLTGRNVTVFPSSWFEEYRTFIEIQRTGKCDTHWGRHSCDNKPGHKNQHRCHCGYTPSSQSVLWGKDITNEDIKEQKERQLRLAEAEIYASWADPFDKDGIYRPGRKRRGIKNEIQEKSAA